MFINRLEVHNNTMVKNTTYLAHTHYIIYCHVKMYQCTNLYKKTGDNSNTYAHLICVKNIIHQAHILLNNGTAELTIP